MGKKKNFNYGFYEEHVTDVVRQLLYDAPKRFRVDIAHNIAFEAANYGGRNMAEAVGILEIAKRTYIETSEEVAQQEFEEIDAMRRKEFAQNPPQSGSQV